VSTTVTVTDYKTHKQQVSLANVGGNGLTYNFDIEWVWDDVADYGITATFETCTKTYTSGTNKTWQKCGSIGSFADVQFEINTGSGSGENTSSPTSYVEIYIADKATYYLISADYKNLKWYDDMYEDTNSLIG